MFVQLALTQALLQAGLALASPTPQYGTQKGIKWSPCDEPRLNSSSIPLTCGTVTVPLDYTDPQSDETLDIELVRAKHTKKPFKGSILMNYGGPGGSGAVEHAGIAPAIVDITGGQYDIIGFDQRGTGKTLRFSCFDDAVTKTQYSAYMAESGNASDVSLGRLWATSGMTGEECRENEKKRGTLIGSAFTARDLMQFVDALDEDGMLRYWGLSYGTALGHTVASMFPDRVDRVILDGNLNPYDYWHYHDVHMYDATDKVWRGLLNACVKHSSKCALAHHGSTAEEIETKVNQWLEKLKYEPMWYDGVLVDWTYVRSSLLGALYSPSSYGAFAKTLDLLMQGDASAIKRFPSAGASGTGDRRYGIVCSDKTTRGAEDAFKASHEVMSLSQIAGDTAVPFIMGCGQWKMAAKERYEGNFNPKTNHPVLIIGNTHDPVTSLASAHNMSSAFPGSVVLTQNGYGHASLAQPSKCTTRVIRQYLLEGKMPEAGKHCDVDAELFAPAA